MHRAWIVFSQVKAPIQGQANNGFPSIFPNVRTGTASFYTSNPHCCPQLTNKRLAVEVSELFGVADRTYDTHRLVVGLERDDGHYPAAELDNDTRLTVDVERRKARTGARERPDQDGCNQSG